MEFSAYLPVWEQLSPAHKEALRGCVTERRMEKGSMIRSEDGDCEGLLLLRQGRMRAYILSPEGREITIYRLLERDLCLFSASCMMRSIQFDVTIEAEKDTDLWVIPAAVYKKIMTESAPLANFTNEVMAARFSDVMWLMEQIMWKSFDKRLAVFLIEEASIEGTDTLRITHEIIGNHLGNPREVVTRMLRYFQSEGFVRLSRGTVEIIDRKALEQLGHS